MERSWKKIVAVMAGLVLCSFAAAGGGCRGDEADGPASGSVVPVETPPATAAPAAPEDPSPVAFDDSIDGVVVEDTAPKVEGKAGAADDAEEPAAEPATAADTPPEALAKKKKAAKKKSTVGKAAAEVKHGAEGVGKAGAGAAKGALGAAKGGAKEAGKAIKGIFK